LKKEHLQLAAHQTAVELCLMHELKKPLTDVCDIVEHDKSVFRMIWKCKIEPAAENSGSLDGRLTFPNKPAKDTLFFVFEQVGREVAPEAEAASEETVVEEEDLEAIEEMEMEDVANQPFFGIQATRDTGFLSISLDDPATKFAVSISFRVSLRIYESPCSRRHSY
jgi:protein kinase C substrate 80K-H